MKILRRKTREPSPPPVNPALSEIERDSLQETVRHAVERIAQIDRLLEGWGLRDEDIARLDPTQQVLKDTDRAAIARRERRELLYEKQRAEKRLAVPSASEIAGMAAKHEHQMKMLELTVQERRAIIDANVRKHEEEGDQMQAAIWRNEILGLRARVALELGLQHLNR